MEFVRLFFAIAGALAYISDGARNFRLSACTGPASSSASSAFTIRCRSSRDFPSNAAATQATSKWLSPPARAPS